MYSLVYLYIYIFLYRFVCISKNPYIYTRIFTCIHMYVSASAIILNFTHCHQNIIITLVKNNVIGLTFSTLSKQHVQIMRRTSAIIKHELLQRHYP